MSDQDQKQQATPEQLAWAKRFLARLEQARKAGHLLAALPAKPAKPLWVSGEERAYAIRELSGLRSAHSDINFNPNENYKSVHRSSLRHVLLPLLSRQAGGLFGKKRLESAQS